MSIEFPKKGFIFWPVGNGDSTTIVVDDETVIQVDLNNLSESNEDDDPHTPISDELINNLPEVDSNPYLSVFALTHPDQDHCRSFQDLLKDVTIGELWFSPRVFREYKKDLCDDAKAFKEEAERRIERMIEDGDSVDSGDRVRIIGYDDLLEEDEFEGFPDDKLTIPGNDITEIDGEDFSDVFRAFVHAPFKDDSSGERNAASLAFQITLTESEQTGKALLLGDHAYPTVNRIFTVSESDDLEWNIFLAPHHCSKSVMYWKEEDEDEESLKQDILDLIEENASSPGYIVASSEPIPTSNQSGDNPPHAKAKNRYQEIVPDDFFCTQEHLNEDNSQPVVFDFDENGFRYVEPEDSDEQDEGQSEKGLGAAVIGTQGTDEPPKQQVGFGNNR